MPHTSGDGKGDRCPPSTANAYRRARSILSRRTVAPRRCGASPSIKPPWVGARQKERGAPHVSMVGSVSVPAACRPLDLLAHPRLSLDIGGHGGHDLTRAGLSEAGVSSSLSSLVPQPSSFRPERTSVSAMISPASLFPYQQVRRRERSGRPREFCQAREAHSFLHAGADVPGNRGAP